MEEEDKRDGLVVSGGLGWRREFQVTELGDWIRSASEWL